MSYPSIITQEGAVERNVEPIIEALSPLLDGIDNGHIMELGSGSYKHIEAFAKKWENVRWWGTVRNEIEQEIAGDRLEKENVRLNNLHEPRIVDISNQRHWDEIYIAVRHGVAKQFSGFIMINLIHCCPIDYSEKVFKSLSPRSTLDPKILNPSKGWIVAYGPWLNDDGSYKSDQDEKFDREYIKSKSPLLGLRSIKSISDIASKWGFVEEQRKQLPKGNMFAVWRVKSP
ncbi:uncharacterized protein IL334_002437 [Kwoniella shivajii]|uniref:Methyltransferase domain-containing protein n=1 Tax=Kwoniella shivajii TaxID=564305 RepID=A0ABZ1CWF9_9TREE|nr:hypothetical protein IL334_002437 [Kwoniella shivajii]